MPALNARTLPAFAGIVNTTCFPINRRVYLVALVLQHRLAGIETIKRAVMLKCDRKNEVTIPMPVVDHALCTVRRLQFKNSI